MKLLEYDRNTRLQWLELCECIEQGLAPHLRVFLMLRRKYRDVEYHVGWTKQVQEQYPAAICEFLKIVEKDIKNTHKKYKKWVENRKTFTEWWERITHLAVWEATRRGLIK